VEHQRNARLHIEHAGASKFVVHNPAWHIRQRAQWVYGVVVAKQQNRLTAGFSGEINLKVIAEIVGAVNSGLAPHGSKPFGDGFRDSIYGRFIVTGRFDFDQLADGRDNPVAPSLKVGKPRLGLKTLDGTANDGRCFVGLHARLALALPILLSASEYTISRSRSPYLLRFFEKSRPRSDPNLQNGYAPALGPDRAVPPPEVMAPEIALRCLRQHFVFFL
jgi:hypothetical protein